MPPLDDFLNFVHSGQLAQALAVGIAQLGDVVLGIVAENLDRAAFGFRTVYVVFGLGILVFQFVGVVGDIRFGDQRFAVFDRDPVIVGVDFVERQKAMAVAAEIDKGRLQRRFDPGHLGKVNVTLELAFGGCFVIEFEEFGILCNDDPGFFRMGRVDEHSSSHLYSLRGRATHLPHEQWVWWIPHCAKLGDRSQTVERRV